MSDSPAPFIQNANKFKIVVKVLNLTNRTTQMEIRNGKRFFGGKADKLNATAKVEFVEFAESGLKLDIPPRTCSTGHKLMLEMEFVTPKRTIVFHTDGIVEHTETVPNQHDCIVVTMSNYDASAWSLIQGFFNQRQSSVTDLFERLKGY